ncbi:unnamed protein product, partial [marine sediment metagenome]
CRSVTSLNGVWINLRFTISSNISISGKARS